MAQQLEKLHTYYARRPGEVVWCVVTAEMWRVCLEGMFCEPGKWEGWSLVRLDATDCPF